jgi:hypothetical protein
MAWDVLVVRLPQGTRRVSALPEGFWPPAFEPAVEIQARLRGIPGIELVDEAWAVVRADDWVVEIDFSTPTRVMLQIEGSDASLDVVRSITRALDAVAIDTTTGEALDWTGDPSSGLRLSRARTEMLESLEGVEANDTERRRR